MNGEILPAKDPAEVILVGVDFTEDLGAETMATIGWVCTVIDGADPSASAMLLGSPINGSAPEFRHMVQAGVAGNLYELRVTITTSGGRTLVGTMELPVRTA